MDDEYGEVGVERNKTLTRVGTQLGGAASGLKSARSCLCSWFLRIFGIRFGFSKTAGGSGSGFDLVYRGFLLGASFQMLFFGIFMGIFLKLARNCQILKWLCIA